MRGLTLVELLVAITLGAIILGGAVTLFVNNLFVFFGVQGSPGSGGINCLLVEVRLWRI